MNETDSTEYKQVQNNNDDTISFLDIGVELAKNIKRIVKIILVFFILGLLFVIIKPSTYTASSKVVAEMDNSGTSRFSSGLSALKSFGLNLGSAGSGILPETYPSLIKSREVLYNVIHQSFYFKNIDSTMTFVDYADYKDLTYYLKKYTFKLPLTIIGFFRSTPSLKKPLNADGKVLFLTLKENKAISILMNDIVSTSLDDETGLITISTKTTDRNLSAEINKAVLNSFQKHIRRLYDQKNSENLNFIKTQLEAAKTDLNNSEQAVVNFLERNSNPQTIQLQTTLERLKRDVSLKADLYSELQLQYAQTKIELKKKEPVIRIVERPTPPINPSGMSKAAIIFLFIFIGLLIGFVFIFLNFIIQILNQDKDSYHKITLIKNYTSKYFSKFNFKHRRG